MLNSSVKIILESMENRLHDLEVDKIKYSHNELIMAGVNYAILEITHFKRLIELAEGLEATYV